MYLTLVILVHTILLLTERNDVPPSVTITAPDSPGVARRLMALNEKRGKIQVRVGVNMSTRYIQVLLQPIYLYY